jgi:hypothetical protein
MSRQAAVPGLEPPGPLCVPRLLRGFPEGRNCLKRSFLLSRLETEMSRNRREIAHAPAHRAVFAQSLPAGSPSTPFLANQGLLRFRRVRPWPRHVCCGPYGQQPGDGLLGRQRDVKGVPWLRHASILSHFSIDTAPFAASRLLSVPMPRSNGTQTRLSLHRPLRTFSSGLVQVVVSGMRRRSALPCSPTAPPPAHSRYNRKD